MDLLKRGYIGEKDRKEKNAKKYILVRSDIVGKQKRNIYSKDSKEYIKHNGKYIQLKNFMKMVIQKKESYLKNIFPCKKDCAAKNKICNKITHRCNIKKDAPKKIATQKQKDQEIYENIFQKHFLNHYQLWVNKKRMDEIQHLFRINEDKAYAELIKDAKKAWNNNDVNHENVGKDDFYKMAKEGVKKFKKPLNEMTIENVDNIYYIYTTRKNKKVFLKKLKLHNEKS